MFGFLKKKEVKKQGAVNSFSEPLDKLVDGELPWGWVTYYKDFIKKTEGEFYYFLQQWYDAKDRKNLKDEYGALKSFLIYMDDVQKLCDQKGECFGFWCSDYLIGEQKEYAKKKFKDLEEKMK